MKKITLPFIVCLCGIAIMLSSCGTMQQSTAFSKRKYYNFRHHDPVVAFNAEHKKCAGENTPAPSKAATNHTEQSPVIQAKAPSESPVLSTTPTTRKKTGSTLVDSRQPHSKSSTTSSSVTSHINAAVNEMAPTNITGGSSSVSLVVLILLAIFISPVAVYLYDNKASKRFWIVLILWLVGIGLGLGFLSLFGLALLVAIIYALLIVTGSV